MKYLEILTFWIGLHFCIADETVLDVKKIEVDLDSWNKLIYLDEGYVDFINTTFNEKVG